MCWSGDVQCSSILCTETRGFYVPNFCDEITGDFKWNYSEIHKTRLRIDFTLRFMPFSLEKCKNQVTFCEIIYSEIGLTLCMPLGVSKKWPNRSWVFRHDDSSAMPFSCQMRTTQHFQHFMMSWNVYCRFRITFVRWSPNSVKNKLILLDLWIQFI